MSDDDRTKTPLKQPSKAAGDVHPDATGRAFFAAIIDWFRRSGSQIRHFQLAARHVAERNNLLTYLQYFALANEEQESAIRQRYPHAILDWNLLEKRARAHGIRFSPTAQAHHRAAILDYLDNPDAPTLIAHKHLTWLAPVGSPDPKRSAEYWRRYQDLCAPLANRDIAHDRAVRQELSASSHLPSLQATRTVAARPRPQP